MTSKTFLCFKICQIFGFLGRIFAIIIIRAAFRVRLQQIRWFFNKKLKKIDLKNIFMVKIYVLWVKICQIFGFLGRNFALLDYWIIFNANLYY